MTEKTEMKTSDELNHHLNLEDNILSNKRGIQLNS